MPSIPSAEKPTTVSNSSSASPRRSWSSTVRCAPRPAALARQRRGRTRHPPRARGRPRPIRSKAVVVPSAEVTVSVRGDARGAARGGASPEPLNPRGGCGGGRGTRGWRRARRGRPDAGGPRGSRRRTGGTGRERARAREPDGAADLGDRQVTRAQQRLRPLHPLRSGYRWGLSPNAAWNERLKWDPEDVGAPGERRHVERRGAGAVDQVAHPGRCRDRGTTAGTIRGHHRRWNGLPHPGYSGRVWSHVLPGGGARALSACCPRARPAA